MPTLKSLLRSTDQSVRLNAALAAGTYPEPSQIEILIAQCAHEEDFFVRDTLSWALMRHERDQVLTRLIEELKSPIPQARSQALHTFSKIGDKENYRLITAEHLFDANDVVASTAWRAASVLVPEEEKSSLVKLLITQLGRGDSELQFGLTRFLCTIGEPIVESLKLAAESEHQEVRMHAKITLIRYQEMQIEFSEKAQMRKGKLGS